MALRGTLTGYSRADSTAAGQVRELERRIDGERIALALAACPPFIDVALCRPQGVNVRAGVCRRGVWCPPLHVRTTRSSPARAESREASSQLRAGVAA